jgi:hypothetical protein
MKFYQGCLFIFIFTSNVNACEIGETEVISCFLPGKIERQVSFCLNDTTQEVSYHFRKSGKTELSVAFDNGNKLSLLKDERLGITYIGFLRGRYGYIFNVITGSEKNEYSISFDIKKDGKVIQSNDCAPNSFIASHFSSKYMNDMILNKSGSGNIEFP